ncbi:MAG: hypothetical protein ACYCPM_07520, partial [Acidobacteriaceae bacterium]
VVTDKLKVHISSILLAEDRGTDGWSEGLRMTHLIPAITLWILRCAQNDSSLFLNTVHVHLA